MIGHSTLATVTSTQPPSSQVRLPTTISAMSSSSTSSRMISASTPEGASRTCSVTMMYLPGTAWTARRPKRLHQAASGVSGCTGRKPAQL